MSRLNVYTNAASRAVTISDGGTSADKLNLHPKPVNILRLYIYTYSRCLNLN